MYRRTACAAAVLVALAFGGCIDLFHTTALPTLCDLDATAQGCANDSGVSVPDAEQADAATPPPDVTDAARVPSDFCAWPPPTARAKAEHACGWLGACAGLLGNNALGTCMVNALLAYDCRINPNRKVQGKLHTYWDCLWQADTCEAVTRCVHPLGVPTCSPATADYFGCGGGPKFEENASVRLACSDAGKLVAQENCIAVGQTCIATASRSCSGPAGADAGCTGVACDGNRLRDCTAAQGDRGVDCALFGKGLCVSTDGGAACAPAESGVCGATADVTCDGGVARGCPAGLEETFDCAALFGAQPAAPCNPTSTGTGWDVSRACTVAGAACIESCDGKIAHACARNAAFTVDCGSLGLVCAMVTSDAKSVATCRP